MRISFIIVGAFALASCGPAQAAGPREALQAACFAPAVLAANPSERTPTRLAQSRPTPWPDAAAVDAGRARPVEAALRGSIRRVELPPGSRKLIALTLDFCEQPGEIAGYDGAIIDILRKERVKATLFMGGKWMVTHGLRTQQLMADPLFEIGTHGWVHRNTRLLAGADLAREITAPTGAYTLARTRLATSQCATGHAAGLSSIAQQVTLYRFPFGACSPASLRVANDAGLLAIQWDVSTGDPSPTTSARAIADTMIRQARPGSIIIAHANGRGYNTADALPAAITGLRAKGFEFVTVTELLAAGRPVIATTCYDSRPGDTDRYDRLFPAASTN